MGCCCGKPVFRFKNLVIAAYPLVPTQTTPTRDGINKLRTYVMHNPEKIPRVGRKVSKLVATDLRRRRLQRVEVGVNILVELVQTTREVRAFVKTIIDMVPTLLDDVDATLHIPALQLLNALLHRMACECTQNNAEQLLRSLLQQSPADSVVHRVTKICRAVGKWETAKPPVRYAALVCVVNFCAALGSRYVDMVEVLLEPVLHVLQSADAATLTTFRDTASLLDRHLAIQSTELPLTRNPEYGACMCALHVMSHYTNATGARPLFRSVVAFLDETDAWGNETLVTEVITVLCSHGTQLGFAPMQMLIDVLARTPRPVNAKIVLRGLSVAAGLTSLVGSRPMQVCGPVVDIIRVADDSVDDTELVRVCFPLLEVVAKQASLAQNTGQCVKIVHALLQPLCVAPVLCLHAVQKVVSNTTGESFWGAAALVLPFLGESRVTALNVLTAIVHHSVATGSKSELAMLRERVIVVTRDLSKVEDVGPLEAVPALLRLLRTLLRRDPGGVSWCVQYIELCQQRVANPARTLLHLAMHDMLCALVFDLGRTVGVAYLEDYGREVYARKAQVDPCERCPSAVLTLQHGGPEEDCVRLDVVGSDGGHPTTANCALESPLDLMCTITRETLATYVLSVDHDATRRVKSPSKVALLDERLIVPENDDVLTPYSPAMASSSASSSLQLPVFVPVRRMSLTSKRGFVSVDDLPGMEDGLFAAGQVTPARTQQRSASVGVRSNTTTRDVHDSPTPHDAAATGRDAVVAERPPICITSTTPFEVAAKMCERTPAESMAALFAHPSSSSDAAKAGPLLTLDLYPEL
eukprot:PhM_4_TR19063/c0_g1_i1/m.103221